MGVLRRRLAAQQPVRPDHHYPRRTVARSPVAGNPGREPLPVREVLVSGKLDPKAFWGKVMRAPKSAGYEIIEKAITLYVLLTESEVPLWLRGSIVACLAYFVWPFDPSPITSPAATWTILPPWCFFWPISRSMSPPRFGNGFKN